MTIVCGDTLPLTAQGQRLDQALAQLFPQYSRSYLQTLLANGLISVNERNHLKANTRVQGGEAIMLVLLPTDVSNCIAQDLALNIVCDDADLIVINKPAGLVTHPGAGNPDSTLQNALLHYDSALATLPRAGLVHRIDKDTSGLLVVARNLIAHTALVRALAQHQVQREYLALVQGNVIAGGTVDAPLGRDPHHRTKMAVVLNGKPAVTHYRVAERFRGHTLLRVQLETGRTHQIRVHLAHRGYPLVGDPAYGARLRLPLKATAALTENLRQFKRQALHATRLSLTHPRTGEVCAWEAPLPTDLHHLLALLREDAQHHVGI